MNSYVAFFEEPMEQFRNGEFGLLYDNHDGIEVRTQFVGVGKTLNMAVELLGFYLWQWHEYDLPSSPNYTSPDRIAKMMSRDKMNNGYVGSVAHLSDAPIVWYHELPMKKYPGQKQAKLKMFVVEEPVIGKKKLVNLRHKLWPHDPYGEKEVEREAALKASGRKPPSVPL